jgi:hypothetical protein
MKPPKNFEEYLQNGVIKTCSPDKSRANFLIEESNNTLIGLKERLEKVGINDNNANSIIKDCYDVIMELIRAKLLLEGYASVGQFAHEAEVSYLRELGFSENEVYFLNEVRYFRNSVTYYGKILNKEYAQSVVDFINRIYQKLKGIL